MNNNLEKNKNRNTIEILCSVKKQTQTAISSLKHVIGMTVEFDYTDDNVQAILDNFIPSNSSMNNSTKLEVLINLCDEISNKLSTNCWHEFEYDYIDITPDVSERICYCVYCESNFKDCKRN